MGLSYNTCELHVETPHNANDMATTTTTTTRLDPTVDQTKTNNIGLNKH